MSLLKYLESKKHPMINVSIEKYMESLHADMSSLLLKPHDQINEVRKHVVNIQELDRFLTELSYPFANKLQMAIRTGDPKKIAHAHMSFRRWAEYSHLNHVISDKIESVLFNYQAKIHGSELKPEDVDDITRSYLAESRAIVDQYVNSLNLAISKISSWENYPVTVEAIIPEDNGWIVKEVKVIIGDTFKASFVLENNSTNTSIKNFESDQLSPSMQKNINALMSLLKSKMSGNKIFTLYMSRPISERRFFEMAKRDLALGIKTSLPKHVLLNNLPIAEDTKDLWKVRVDQKYLYEYLNEGDSIQYRIITDDCPIRWIEKVSP